MNKVLPIIILLVFSSNFLFAQATSISGTVKDERGRALNGLIIIEKGASKRVFTSDDGKFKLEVKSLPTTLLIAGGLSFQNNEVIVNNTLPIDIILKVRNDQLDEVVVVGYQKQSLRKTTGAMQIISGKVIEDLPSPSFENLLQGRVSGVNIQNITGAPGARNTFTIRGNSTISLDIRNEVNLANTVSSPLYIIDGIPLSISDLSKFSVTGSNYVAGINVNDIESIVIQKDAAATAVWGSRGANGIVIINTKRGKSGVPQIRLSYYKGITDRPNLETTFLGTAEREQKLDIISQYANYLQLGRIPHALTDSLNNSYNNATDWQELFYTTGNIDNVDLSFSGGSDLMTYRMSLGYYNEGGIIRSTGFKRYSFSGNFGFNLTPYLKSDLVFAASRVNREVGLGRGIDGNVPISQSSKPSSFVQLGEFDYDYFYGEYDKNVDKNKSDLISLSSKTYIDIIKGLQYSFEGSIHGTLDSRNQFQPREINRGRNFASSSQSNGYTYNLSNVINYSKPFRNHNINITGIQSFQYDDFETINLGAYDLPTDDIHVVTGIPASKLSSYGSNIYNSGLLSYLGQFSYDYKSKYILNFSYRADASSRFGKDAKWGYFPSVSGAWIVSDEKFLENVKFIDFFKLRGSWGQSGGLPGEYYGPFNVWELSTNTYNGEGLATPSFTKPVTLNSLTWSKSNQTNLGFDLNLFNSRLTFVYDMYRRNTIGPILSFPYPFYTGYTQLSYNVPMTIYNEGVDITVSSRNMSPTSKFQWQTTLNLTFNKNRIGALPDGNRPFLGNSSNIEPKLLYQVGGAIYQWTQILYKGVYNRLEDIPVNPITGERLTYLDKISPVIPGYPNLYDVNGDWDVWIDEILSTSDGDLVPTGNPNPKLTGGIFNQFSYKNFSFGILGVFTLGRDVLNSVKSGQLHLLAGDLDNLVNNSLFDVAQLDYWTPEKAKDPNYKAGFPSINPYTQYFYQFAPFHTLFNENGNYFKIKSLTLGYSVPESLLKKINIGFKSVRFYGTADNIITFQASSIPDAELVDPQGNYSGDGYRLPRKYTLGVELNF